jgi:hypothetical protein
MPQVKVDLRAQKKLEEQRAKAAAEQGEVVESVEMGSLPEPRHEREPMPAFPDFPGDEASKQTSQGMPDFPEMQRG